MKSRLRKVLRDPRRALRLLWGMLLDGGLRLFFSVIAHSHRTRDGSVVRKYLSYGVYRVHQKLKLCLIAGHLQKDYEPKFENALFERLQDLRELGILKKKGAALCLAARLGAEVRAFRRAGFFAVGIDLNPGKRNPWVLPGDFHNLQFANESVDVVYSNSLDHVLDLKQFTREVHRILHIKG
ncbi:class I SAM-dependent methyltransferase [Candidatus Parcubacteria bacterium]|nr:MAG: class I SAM-dependent methyltransferase [Candidatus Parcubacteria bacterium]